METIKPYLEKSSGKKEQVAEMFDKISPGYDQLNRVISFGRDQVWRKRLIAKVLDKHPKSLLDIATGTGDLAIRFAETPIEKVVGIDLSEGMLSVGRNKVKRMQYEDRVELLQGDAEQLCFNDHSFDAVTVAFGIRNFEQLERGLSEIFRVLKPRGTFAILETSVPSSFHLKWGYKLYTHYLLPLIGRLFSKDKRAYAYLGESAAHFPYGERLNNILTEIGFIHVECLPQTFGAASLYIATK